MSVHRIAICGQSLFISVIKANLATAMPEVEIVRLDARFPDLIGYITTLQPNMIIIERNNAHNDLVLALVNQGLPLIKLDIGQNEAMLLSSVRVPIVETDDLVQMIEHVLDANF